MSHFLYYVFLGFAPALFYLWYFYRKDRWEPEPKWEIFKVFMIGLFAIVPAGILEIVFQNYVFKITQADMREFFVFNVIACFIVIGPLEEFFKYSVVKAFVYPKDVFNEKMDGVVYMVAAAMGFSALENVLYIANAGAIGGAASATYLGILRGVLATPAHAVFSGFVGVYLGQAKFAPTSTQAAILTIQGLVIGIFLHGLYDFLLFSERFGWLVIPLMIVSAVILVKMANRLVDESPFKPKPLA